MSYKYWIMRDLQFEERIVLRNDLFGIVAFEAATQLDIRHRNTALCLVDLVQFLVESLFSYIVDVMNISRRDSETIKTESNSPKIAPLKSPSPYPSPCH